MEVVALLLALAFTGLSVLHLYWAAGGNFGSTAVIPVVEGRPLFTPGVTATLFVALVLLGFALVALALGFRLDVFGVFHSLMPYLGMAIGGVLVLRSIGEFRYLGFFKRVKGSRFATYDSWLFSPFCLMAGLAFLALAAGYS
ncbi:DUF3995 domain-containing protein [Billgrantia desiderata]|uniref:DUF3995 domain-containing protein n=1 Tax=Billgrantia desiderata TaxID=52021 RepID=UPI001F3EA190|nr:DUF3995 domain-containing protein [Halomonas desiderata]